MFINDWDRYCYLSGRALSEAIDDSVVLDALIDQLNLPGKKSTLADLTPDQKLREIEIGIEQLGRSGSAILRNLSPQEALAVLIWRAHRLSEKRKLSIFSGVRTEACLLKPVSRWLRDKGMGVFAEVPLGRPRIDVLGYKEGGFWSGDQFVGVELKNEDKQFARGLDQMTSFAEYAHEVYMACTPAFAIEYLDRHAEAHGVRRWDSELLERKLKNAGLGLLIVDGDDVSEILEPRQSEPTEERLALTKRAIAGRRPVAA